MNGYCNLNVDASDEGKAQYVIIYYPYTILAAQLTTFTMQIIYYRFTIQIGFSSAWFFYIFPKWLSHTSFAPHYCCYSYYVGC